MRWRDVLTRWAGTVAIGAFALLILVAGLSCMDQGAMHHHGVSVDFCSVAIATSVGTLGVGALLLLGLTPTPGRPLLATIHLAVPEPPPRRISFA